MSSSIAVFNGHRRVPPPSNEPIRSYAPGSPERASLKAKLKAMAGEKIDMPLIIGGKEVRTGDCGQSVMPHDHAHVLGDYHKATEQHVQQAVDAAKAAQKEWAALVVRRSRRRHPQGRRAADHVVARHDQRGDDARPVEDGVSGRDRFGLRDHRLLALQRPLRRRNCSTSSRQRPHDVESARVPRPRRIRLRRHAVQLHVDRREPADRARADGQHGRLEAGVERDVSRRTT